MSDTMVDDHLSEDELDAEELNDLGREAIALRAYEISQTAESGSELDNWLQAEREVTFETGYDG